MNKVILIGNLTRDMEMSSSKTTGKSVAKGTIAINNGKNQNGDEIPADFLRFYAFGNLADNLSKYCKKGSKVAIDGRLKYRTWDKEDGTKGYETAVYANSVEFLDSKRKEEVPFPEEESNVYQEQGDIKSSDPFEDFGEEVVINDEDLPF